MAGGPDNGSGELGQADVDAAAGLSHENANATSVHMRLAGRRASVLADEIDSCSGGRAVGDSLVGLLFVNEVPLGVGLTGPESDAAVLGEEGSLIMLMGQFIRGSSIMSLALFYDRSCFLEISLFCTILLNL